MSPLWKDILREITQTKGRFISLMIIAGLGVASVVGIYAAAIDMRAAADKMYKDSSLYDIQLKSTTGFDGDDIAALQSIGGIEEIMPAQTADVYIYMADLSRTVRTHSLPGSINTLTLISGRLPENSGECVVEPDLLAECGYEIGDTIVLGLDDMESYHELLYSSSFTITGTVSSPLYISIERGNTTIGGGSLDYYIYLHPAAYNLSVYTDLYLRMDGSERINNLSDEYEQLTKDWQALLETAGEKRVNAKKSEFLDLETELADGFASYYEGVDELSEKLAEGRAELEDARVTLEDAKKTLESSKSLLDREIKSGLDEISRNEDELISGQAELDEKAEELKAGQVLLTQSYNSLGESLLKLQAIGPEGVSPELDAQYAQIYGALAQLDIKQAELDAGTAALTAAQRELDSGAQKLAEARSSLEAERWEAQAEIDRGWAEYYSGLDEYNEGMELLLSEEEDAKKELDEARAELADAQEKLDGAPEPEWYYLSRKSGVSFDSYYQDTLRLQKIGNVFPMVFFLVAVLVSLTGMSRMVDDHRTQIGVYKALGYKPGAIMTKYFVYAASSSFLGGLLGVGFGMLLFPPIIIDAYGYLYNMPQTGSSLPLHVAALSVAAAVAAIVAVTLITCASSMSETPALLMRPKPPRAGKRVLLERIPLIWNRMGFIEKVTARNIFRYKRRFFMTLAGVAGCTALLLTAFGMRNSVSGVARIQFTDIALYEARVYLKDITSEKQRDEINSHLPFPRLYIHEESVDTAGVSGELSASLIIPDDPGAINDFIRMFSPYTGEELSLPTSGALVTEKLARTLGVSEGDSFTLTPGEGDPYTLTVAGIVENYVLHYIYVSLEYYSDVSGRTAPDNGLLLSGIDEHDRGFAEELLKNDSVRAVSFTSDLLSTLTVSTDALGVVTIVLLGLACALAFVVLFNLTNINISERLRELATIKVLGFQEGEVAAYVYRENGLVTLMGIALGLFGGVYLNDFVLSAVEIDLLKFPHVISPLSFVLAAALSLLFAAFVSWVTSYKLSAIDMVASLKSIE